MRSICADLLLQRMGDGGIESLGRPLNRGLYECIRQAILDGSLVPSSRLPSSRDLAHELGLSRNTVTYAYDQLLAEGYVRSLTGSGTFVAGVVPDSYALGLDAPKGGAGAGPAPRPAPRLSLRGRTLVEHALASPQQWGAFMPGVPDVTEVPNRRFAQILNQLWRRPPVELLTYGAGGGHPGLRQALAGYLKQARSVQCEPDQILITEGVHHAIDLIVRMLGDAGDTAWIEEPGYWGIRGILQVNGMQMQPVPVDAEGLQFPLKPYEQPPRLIFVTPSHQYPLGPVMSLGRRTSLIEFATRRGSWIVEDDYDSEFRFSGQPIPSLQGMLPDTPVIYIGTFSKTLYPGMRVAYMVLPRELVGPLRAAQSELYREGHGLQQAALAEFIEGGHYAAHIRRMRLLYGARRNFLIGLVERWLGREWLHPLDSAAGLHLILNFPPGLDDVAVARRAREKGVLARPLSRYYSSNPARGLLLGFASVPEAQMVPAFETLVGCIRDEMHQGLATEMALSNL